MRVLYSAVLALVAFTAILGVSDAASPVTPALRSAKSRQLLTIGEIIEGLSFGLISEEQVQALQSAANAKKPQILQVVEMLNVFDAVVSDDTARQLAGAVVDAATYQEPLEDALLAQLKSLLPDGGFSIPATLALPGAVQFMSSLSELVGDDTIEQIEESMNAETPQGARTLKMLNSARANGASEGAIQETATAMKTDSTVSAATLAEMEAASEEPVPAAVSVPGAAILIRGLKGLLSPKNGDLIENFADSITPQAVQVLSFMAAAVGAEVEDETIDALVQAFANTAILTFDVFSDLTQALPDDVTVPASLTFPSYADMAAALQGALSKENVDALDGALDDKTPQINEIANLLVTAVGLDLSEDQVNSIVASVIDAGVFAADLISKLASVLPSDVEIPASLSIEGAWAAFSEFQSLVPADTAASMSSVMTSNVPDTTEVLDMLVEGVKNGMPSSLVDSVGSAVGSGEPLSEEDAASVSGFLTTKTLPASLTPEAVDNGDGPIAPGPGGPSGSPAPAPAAGELSGTNIGLAIGASVGVLAAAASVLAVARRRRANAMAETNNKHVAAAPHLDL